MQLLGASGGAFVKIMSNSRAKTVLFAVFWPFLGESVLLSGNTSVVLRKKH